MIAYRTQFSTRLKLGKFFCRRGAQVAVIATLGGLNLVTLDRSFKSRTQLRAVRQQKENGPPNYKAIKS